MNFTYENKVWKQWANHYGTTTGVDHTRHRFAGLPRPSFPTGSSRPFFCNNTLLSDHCRIGYVSLTRHGPGSMWPPPHHGRYAPAASTTNWTIFANMRLVPAECWWKADDRWLAHSCVGLTPLPCARLTITRPNGTRLCRRGLHQVHASDDNVLSHWPYSPMAKCGIRMTIITSGK
jgi:hypothetical protein